MLCHWGLPAQLEANCLGAHILQDHPAPGTEWWSPSAPELALETELPRVSPSTCTAQPEQPLPPAVATGNPYGAAGLEVSLHMWGGWCVSCLLNASKELCFRERRVLASALSHLGVYSLVLTSAVNMPIR